MVILTAAGACAEHGQFDRNEIDPVDEAYIFTPSGFERAGKPAVASGPSTARLNVTICDTATGRPTLCRVNVVGSDGNFYQPQDNPLLPCSLTGSWPETLAGNRPSKAPIRYFGHFFYSQGKFSVEVPAGPVRVEVWKGFEYRPVAASTQVEAGGNEDVSLSIARSADVAREGWYSGDPHLHFTRANDADERTIFDLLEAEDIRFGSILCFNENTSVYRGLMTEQATPQLLGLGIKSVRSRGDYQIISGQEYRNGVLGHLNLYLRDRMVLEGSQLDPNVGPVFGAIGEETRARGGHAFHAHGGYALEIWADLVQRATSGVELLQFGIYRGIGLEGWYHALSAGFRFPGVGASDYPACRKLGDCRTYVHLAGEPNFRDWLQGAAEGRSFMTSGPLILLDVEGQLPGDTMTMPDSTPRTLKARVRVLTEESPVTDVQLIVGGRVVETLKAKATPGEGQRLEMTTPVVVNESTWIAARAFSKSPSGSADAEAHTNPVYVHLDGRPPYCEADADWLVARLDEQIADHEARSVPEKAVPLEYFRRAREMLLELQRCEAKRSIAKPAEPGESVSPSGEKLADILKPVPAKSPAEAAKLFETQARFRMELVAHEPDVTDPVAACFDENGGMYVAEMIDYPYRPKEGETPLGRVRYLQDTDDDGTYDKSSIFADQIVWPTGVVCWKGGVYVAAAPDIWYLKDEDGDRRADVRTKVYTGFGDRNQQGGVNNLNWHIDHTIYGSGSMNGGEIRPADQPGVPPIVLADRDFRFDPVSGRFETVSGSEQFGNAFDDWFNRFLCSQANPAYHVVLPEHYLARNPLLAVPTSIADLAPGVTPIFRISPIEKWREIRSSRRLAVGERSADSSGLSHDVIDAAAGLTIYRGGAYPPEYRGNLFVGCSQNNLVHRRKLMAERATFRSQRADEKTEFVRTTDTWFRPVNCIGAPDGTLYVLDMSREVIESVHIASDVVAHLDLKSGRDKGRIYRLAPPGFKPAPQPRSGQATTAELVECLENPDGWWRDTASRLIYERQDRSIVELLRRRLVESPSDVGRMHILWALDGLKALDERDVTAALADASPGVREHAVRLAERRLTDWPALLDKMLPMAADPEPRVRFQVAFTLGETSDPRSIAALASIAARDIGDDWIRTAVLSSCSERSGELIAALAKDNAFLAQAAANSWLEQLAAIEGAGKQAAKIARVLEVAAGLPHESPAASAIVAGLGAGMQRAGGSLEDVRSSASAGAATLVERLLAEAARTAADETANSDARIQAVRLVSYGGAARAIDSLAGLLQLDPRQSEAVQLAAVGALTRFSDPEIAKRLIEAWQSSTPKVQDEIAVALGSRAAWAAQLLGACASGQITPGRIPPATRAALLGNRDAALRDRAQQLFGDASSPRAEAIARYRSALALAGDVARGEKVYERECMTCHRLGERGFQVGPNLALIRNRTPAALLEAILDPNREVPPIYVNYVVVDESGRTTSGLVVAETAASVTLGRNNGVTETILKQNIDRITSTGMSLMPEGMETLIDPQAMADLLAFLAEVQYDIGTLPDFAQPGK